MSPTAVYGFIIAASSHNTRDEKRYLRREERRGDSEEVPAG
jgi:hypothetical protein